MSMIFDRPAFATGMMILKYDDADGNPVRFVLKPTDKGKSIEFPSETEAVSKYGNGKWLLTNGEHNSKKSQRANDKAQNKGRKF